MTNHTSKLLCSICIVVCLTGITLSVQSGSQTIESPKSFSLTLLEYLVKPDGTKELKAVINRDVDIDGNWTQQRRLIGKDKEQTVERNEEGFFLSTESGPRFKVNDKPVSQELTEMRRKMRSTNHYTQSPDYVGPDTILNLNVFRLRRTINDNEWLEFAYSPVTGDTPLRAIFHNQDGSEIQIEAVKIEFK